MILDLYSYDSNEMMKKLTKSSRRSLTSISTTLSFTETSRIKKAMMHFLDHLNSYTSDYKQKLRRLKHVTSVMFSNRMLLQNITQQLFKINLVKKKRKTKSKKDEQKSTYDTAFERVLTQKSVKIIQREKKKRVEALRKKKKTMKVKRLMIAFKKKERKIAKKLRKKKTILRKIRAMRAKMIKTTIIVERKRRRKKKRRKRLDCES